MNNITTVECNENQDGGYINGDAQVELDRYKEYLATSDFEIIYVISDKVGDVLRRGTCRCCVMSKIREWADAVGGSCEVLDVIC